MTLHFRSLTNRYLFIGFIVFLVGILTAINNFYFYDHVERTTYRNASQLQSILKDEISFCREKKNKISRARYKNNMKKIVKNFSKKAYYNDKIILNHESGELLFIKAKNKWDKVVASHIYITIPKLKSDNELDYYVHADFDYYLYLISIVRSMTFSIFDKGPKVFNDNNITIEDEKLYIKLQEKNKTYTDKIANLNNSYKDTNVTISILNEYSKKKKQLSKYRLSHEEFKKFKKLQKEISDSQFSSYDIYIAWLRSRPAIGFTFFTIILIWLFRRRELEIAKTEKELEKEKKNREILETTFGISEQDDEIKLYEAIINNDMDKLRAIKSISPTMNILKFNAIVDHTEEEKLKLLEILIDKKIDLSFRDDEGMTALMYYALGNKDNHKDSKIIETLIKNGLDINAQNNSGMTALMLCAVKNRPASVQILIDNGADKNTKQDLTAKELAATKEIRDILNAAENHNPQQLVKLLSNFTHAPMKFTTHTWDFGKLSNVFGTFDEAMDAVKEEFKSIEPELKDLSQSLHEKIKTFLFNDDSELDYSWCSKANINIGWSNIQGKNGETLQEYCDNGNNAFDFKLETSLIVNNNEVSTFGDVINLFKQEIELRTDFKNLEPIFTTQKKKLGRLFKVDLSDAKLNRQFYSDTQKLSYAIEKIFSEIKKRKDHPLIEVKSRDLDDKSIEITITQVDSKVSESSQELLKEIEDGDFADMRELLLNLCDWSIEATCEDGDFRVNYLHSNNVKDIKPLSKTVLGFTHILRFYR